MPDRVVVAMSGGVDSSVAAALMKDQGFDVIGITLQLWGKDVCSTSGTKLCCSVKDTLDAKAVCRRLGVQHEVLELPDAFREHVIDYFVDEYQQGRTPNPCIACNTHIKFGSLFERANALEAKWIVSGHYARLRVNPAGRTELLRACDLSKDQSYVLFDLSQAQLSRMRFPLGELSKQDARDKARELDFINADKPDSQDICFVRDRNKDGFLRRELPIHIEPGPIVDRSGQVLGTHQGLLGYTIGQREGIGIAVGKPIYVVELDMAGNRLIVGERNDLLKHAFIAERVNWISIDQPSEPLRASVKIRSRHEAAEATLEPLAGNRTAVRFDIAQPAITPGQAAVFYDGERVLGGGWIASAPTSASASLSASTVTSNGSADR